jgi:hypothetical protein
VLLPSSARARWFASALAAVALEACGASAFIPEDGASPDVDPAAQTDGGARVDGGGADSARVAPALDCAPEGRGELQVRLQVAPNAVAGDLWVAALCGKTLTAGPSDERPLRVIRVPRGSSTVTLSGLGDGYFRVLASLPGSPAGLSGVVAIQRGASAATFVSVGAGAQSMLTVEAPAMPVADAGAVLPPPLRDAGVSQDATVARPQPTTEYDIAGAAGLSLGRVGLRFNVREPGWVDASFDLANTCSNALCPTLRVTAIELRIEQNGLPRALVSLPLGATSRGATVGARESFATESRIVPLFALDPTARMTLTVYGGIE